MMTMMITIILLKGTSALFFQRRNWILGSAVLVSGYLMKCVVLDVE